MGKAVDRFISEKDEEGIRSSFGVPKYYSTDYGNVLVVEKVHLPKEYNINCVNIAIKVIYGYNGQALFDMFWTFPYIGFLDKEIGVFPKNSILCDLKLKDVIWQRWSRHYDPDQYTPCTALQHISWSYHQIEREAELWLNFRK